MAKIKICYDTFDICNRIKMLDRDYFIVYDTNSCRYEIHNSSQKDNTFCISVDGELDYRAIVKLRKTNSNNIQSLLDEIEKHNNSLDKEKDRKIKDETSWKAGEMYSYANSNEEANFDNAYKISWV